MIRLLALILSLVIAAPALAQVPHWDPAAEYITAGQDEPGYRSWYMAHPARAMQVKAFNDYLATYEVGGIVPTWQLFRTATAWQRCGGQPFEIPPTSEWPHIVQTLRYVRDYVIPRSRPGRAGLGLSQPDAERLRRRRAGKRAQTLFGDRPGAAAADHARGADADLVRGPRTPGTGLWRRPRLLCLPPLPRRHHQISPLEHGPGGRFALPADRSPAGSRQRRPAACQPQTTAPSTPVAAATDVSPAEDIAAPTPPPSTRWHRNTDLLCCDR